LNKTPLNIGYSDFNNKFKHLWVTTFTLPRNILDTPASARL
jgi:hypothetical protein